MRERQVAADLAKGASLKVIASNLSITVQTVSTHLTRVKAKVGAASRYQLLASLAGENAEPYDLPGSIRCRATAAELTICDAIVTGRSYGSLARERGVSIRTVQHQAQSLFAKCGVSSRYELTALIVRGD